MWLTIHVLLDFFQEHGTHYLLTELLFERHPQEKMLIELRMFKMEKKSLMEI